MKIRNLDNVYDQPVKGHYETEDYVFFWSGPFSNWHPSKFSMENSKLQVIKFNRAEQAMMYFKAELFGDEDSMGKIMRTNDPSLQKKIGRAVANYDEEVWKEKRYNIVFQLLVEKFKQNSDLKSILLNTGDKCIVECSPYDKIWGIGMGVDQYPEILDKSNWKGENLLGEILMNVRSWLRDGYANLPVERNIGEILKLKMIDGYENICDKLYSMD